MFKTLTYWMKGYTQVPKNVVLPTAFQEHLDDYGLYSKRGDSTPDMISQEFMKANPDAVFVFGSNIQGSHGGGAAILAANLGCPMGFGEGYHSQSQTYAIPTLDFKPVDEDVIARNGKVTVEALSESMKGFFASARANSDHTFYLTPIGTGIGGWDELEVMDALWEGLH